MRRWVGLAICRVLRRFSVLKRCYVVKKSENILGKEAVRSQPSASTKKATARHLPHELRGVRDPGQGSRHYELSEKELAMKRKTLLILVGVVLAAILVLAGGFYFMSMQPLYRPGMVSAGQNLRAPLAPPASVRVTPTTGSWNLTSSSTTLHRVKAEMF